MKYFLCDKCGNSILFVNEGEGNGGMCAEPMPVRASGICGGGYTIELVPKTEISKPMILSNKPAKLRHLMTDKIRFLNNAGKVKLTPVMASRKAAQLRNLNRVILMVKTRK